jgi:hypothetical protein
MGYRSDVRAVIYGPSDTLQRFVTSAKLDNTHKKVFEYFADSLRVYTVDGRSMLDLECGDVKWYDDYEDVRAWHDFMDLVDTDATWDGLEYEFVRVGEEDGDIEKESSNDPDGLLMVSRPAIDIDIVMHLTKEGFPDETDQDSAGEK